MRAMAGYSRAENLEDARRLARLMRTLNDMAKPTIALVQGPAYGGGVGLVACCDVAIAVEDAKFCLSEVKLGLIPADRKSVVSGKGVSVRVDLGGSRII